MSRAQPPGPPPGLFTGPDSGDVFLAWLIPGAALAAVVICGGIWLAGEVSWLAGETPAPGRPMAYLKALAGGRMRWPGGWGWAAAAVGEVVLIIAAITVISLATARSGRTHRAERVARYLAPRRDRARLGRGPGCGSRGGWARGRAWSTCAVNSPTGIVSFGSSVARLSPCTWRRH